MCPAGLLCQMAEVGVDAATISELILDFKRTPLSPIPDVDIQGGILGGIKIAHLAVGVHASVDESDEVLPLVTPGVAGERCLGTQRVSQVFGPTRGLNAIRLSEQLDDFAMAQASSGELCP